MTAVAAPRYNAASEGAARRPVCTRHFRPALSAVPVRRWRRSPAFFRVCIVRLHSLRGRITTGSPRRRFHGDTRDGRRELRLTLILDLIREMSVAHDNPKERRERPHAGHYLAVQTARLHLPQQRDLRRHQRRLGLRPPRRRVQEQRQARLVGHDDAHARRYRGRGRQHPDGAACLAGVWPRRASSPIRWWTAPTARGASAPIRWRR